VLRCAGQIWWCVADAQRDRLERVCGGGPGCKHKEEEAARRRSRKVDDDDSLYIRVPPPPRPRHCFPNSPPPSPLLSRSCERNRSRAGVCFGGGVLAGYLSIHPPSHFMERSRAVRRQSE
jgi:hypothetical protein